MSRSIIEEKRKMMKLTQEEAANKLNVSRQYYNALENNRKMPSVELAKAIGDLFGLNWTIFFGE
jgi:putative transcriptional regulator